MKRYTLTICTVISIWGIGSSHVAKAGLPTPYLQVCQQLGGLEERTDVQQNFSNICNQVAGLPNGESGSTGGGADDIPVANLRHEEIAAQGTVSMESAKRHVGGVAKRVGVLRQSIRGGGAGDEDNELLEMSRWGFFSNVSSGKGERAQTIGVSGANALGDSTVSITQGERAFDFKGKELTVGVDYRFPGEQLIIGGAAGYTQQNGDFVTQWGSANADGFHISAYGTYLPTPDIYVDGIVDIGNNQIDSSRPIPVFDNTSGQVLNDGRAFASTDSQQLSVSIGTGFEFQAGGFNFTPYSRLDYLSTKIDGYTETVQDTNPTGRDSRGMILAVGKQSIGSLTGSLGVRASQPISTHKGVVLPQVSAELVHQFKNDARSIDAALPVAENLVVETPSSLTSATDRTYLRLSAGASVVFPGGHSAFVMMESLQGNNDLSDTAFRLGYRTEF